MSTAEAAAPEGFSPMAPLCEPAEKRRRTSTANKMPMPEDEEEGSAASASAAASGASGGVPQIHRWMVGESYGKPSQLWFRDCKKVFNDELEDQFQAGEDVREFQWVGGRFAKVFLHNLVHMTQTNNQ